VKPPLPASPSGDAAPGSSEPETAVGASGPAGRNGTLYIFDMGGVVSFDSGFERKVAASLGMVPRRLYSLTDREFQELTAGRISLEEFWRRVAAKTGRRIEEDLFATQFHPRLNRRVVRLIQRLRRSSKVVAGTNTVEPHYRIHREAGHYDLFDRVYASCHMGLAKPDPEFFRYILKRERRRAEECVFVDDRQDNVEAASRLGISALLFQGARRLERDLAALAPVHSGGRDGEPPFDGSGAHGSSGASPGPISG
jgi:HAD superfamily hydrolase (TIGR01509 family)